MELLTVYATVVFIPEFFIAEYAEFNPTDLLIIVALMITFILFQVIYRNTLSMNDIYEKNCNDRYFQWKRAKKLQGKSVAAIMCISVLSMTLVANALLGNIIFAFFGRALRPIGTLFSSLFGSLFKFILGDGGPPEETVTQVMTATETLSKETESLTAEPTTEERMQIKLEMNDTTRLIIFIILICIVVLIVTLIGILIWYKLKNYKKIRNVGYDRIEFIEHETKIEKTEVKEEPINQNANFIMRKLYKKRVMKGYSNKYNNRSNLKGPNKNMYPEQITAENISKNTDKISQITGLYEKAR